MLKRPIPATGSMLPVVGLGTWQVFDVGNGAAELAERRQVVEALIAGGGSVIDSSPMYGRSEAVVGKVLTAMTARQSVFLATKVWTQGREAGIAQMEASLDRMAAGGVMDLMQIHNLVDWRTHLATLRAWKGEGRVRHIGITHYTTSTLDELATILERERIDAVQTVYSIGVRAAEKRLLAVAKERGVAVICNLPFGSGGQFAKVRGKPLPEWAAELGIASWGQYFLKYLIGHPAVTCVIPGTSQAQHMTDNCGAGVGVMPNEAQRQKMAAYWDAL